ncbi:hypothetical protein, partial [Agrobacterium tumefaciens]
DTFQPAPRLALKEPASSIASLPIDAREIDPDEEFDGDDVLVAWALSQPGSSTGMSAPLLVRRALVVGTSDQSIVNVAAPTESAATFDNGRFSSGG